MSKKIIIFAIVGLAIAALVFFMGGSDDSSSSSSSSPLTSSTGIGGQPTTPTDTLAAGGDFAQLLSNVDNIRIDTSIFEDPSYKALRDNRVVLIPEPIGRPNPFAPIGTDIGSSDTSPIVETIQPDKVTATGAEFSARVTLRDSVPVQVVFEYGTSDVFGSVTAPVTLTKSDTVIMQAKDLVPGTTYLVRAVARYGSTAYRGQNIMFPTSAAPAATR